MTNPADELWTADQCAEAWGVTPKTWHSYVSRGYAPKPDPADRVGRTPRWRADKVAGARDSRPGQGRQQRKGVREQLDATLAFTETLTPLEAEYREATDITTSVASRVQDAGEAIRTLSLMASVMDELRAYCTQRADDVAATLPGLRDDPEEPSEELLRADTLRILFRDLARDHQRIALNAAGLDATVRAAVYPD